MKPRNLGPQALLFAALLLLAARVPAQPSGLALSRSFASVVDEGGGIPPDPQGAAGPEHLLAMTNTRFTVQKKDGSAAATWTPAQFWAAVSHNDLLFDPRVMYDALSGRWIAVMATAGVTAAPAILLAVSDGSDPTQPWKTWRIPADPFGVNYAEFPLLGGNARWICVAANELSLSSGAGSGAAVWAIEKATLLSGGPLAFTRFTVSDAGSPIAPVVTFDADEPDELLVRRWSVNDHGRGEIALSRVTDVGGHPALRTVAVVAAPEAWIAHPAPFDVLPQAGAVEGISASQDDIASACLRNGEIWAVQTATIPAGTVPQHSVVQWWRVTKAGALSGFGRIGDATGAAWLGYPSVAVNERGQAVIGYSIFSADSYASAAYSLRAADGCDAAFAEIHLLKSGEAPYVRHDASGLNRWGDLTEAVVDPADDLSMWTIQEYAAPQFEGASRWGTWWGGFSPAAASREGACISPVHASPPATFQRREAKNPS